MIGPGPDDGTVGCGTCGEVIYFGHNMIIQNHKITELPDGRVRWFSRDFGMVVHECPIEFSADQNATISRPRLASGP